MINLYRVSALLLILGLVSCDDKPADSTVVSQQTPKDNSSEPFQNIDLLSARRFENQADFATLSARGDRYFETGQYREAIQAYEQALSMNPMCADCLNDKGLALFYLGDPLSALKSIDKAIGLDPEYTHAWLSKGFILVSSGKYQEAVAPLNKVKQLDASGTLAKEADKFLTLIAEKSPR